MSLETVLRSLPAEPYPVAQFRGERDPELEDLLRRLGQLLGEEGVDEVVARYGTKGCGLHAVGLVLEGWMSVDPDAATAAFLAMEPEKRPLGSPVGGPPDSPFGSAAEDFVVWKGQKLLPVEWGDFSRIGIWQLYGGVIAAATRVDPERGLELLGSNALASDFNSLVRDYVGALSRESNWMEVHATLSEVADGIEAPMPNAWDPIPVEVAKRWAESDLHAAMGWLLTVETRSGRGATTSHLAEVLHRTGRRDGINWMEQNMGTPKVGDELLIAFAWGAREFEQKDVLLEQLSALATEPETKVRIAAQLYPGSPMGPAPDVDPSAEGIGSMFGLPHLSDDAAHSIREQMRDGTE